jgi:hypothetical protein
MFFRNAHLQMLRNVIARVGGGVNKRIDENRELLELLQSKAPALLDEYPWIEGWLKSHDEFFVEIEEVAGVVGLFPKRPDIPFPRPWPGTTR